MRSVLWVGLSFVSLALAGCASGGEEDAGPSNVAAFDEGDGAGSTVSGRILDDQQLPVAGAQVGLFGRGDADSSDDPTAYTPEDGSFVFENVPAGVWVLAAGAIGYEAVSRQINVVEGENLVEQVINLATIAVAASYYETQHMVFEITFGLSWQIGGDFNDGCIFPGVTCQGIGFGTIQDHATVEESENSPLATIVLEETWEPNLYLCSRGVWIDFYSPDNDDSANPSFDNPFYW